MTANTNTNTAAASLAAEREIEDCPELNMSNYDTEEVDRLNDWAIRADAEIDRLRAALAAQAPAPVAPSDPSITLDFKMATELLGMFGGEPGLVTLQLGGEHSHSGAGLYAFWSDMPEEGAAFLGAEPDDDADPTTAAGVTAAPAQAGEYPELPDCKYAQSGDIKDFGWYSADQMRAYVDADRAARGAAQAAPVDADVQQDQGEFNRGFNAATCVALQVLRGFGDTDSTAWREILNAAGRKEVENYAKNIAPENWKLCGFAHIAARAAQGGA